MVVAIIAGFILMAPELLYDAGHAERALLRLRIDYLRLRQAAQGAAEPGRIGDIAEDLRSSFESVNANGVLEALRRQHPAVDSLLTSFTREIDAILREPTPSVPGGVKWSTDGDGIAFDAAGRALMQLDARVGSLIRAQAAALRTGVWAVLALLVGVMVILMWLNSQNHRLLASLNNALEEKNLQIQETHHRVKNNLALVASLINIKEASAGADVDLTDLRSRILAIRTVHDNLARGDSGGEVEMSSYVGNLVEAVVNSLPATRIEADVQVPTLRLPAKQAVAVGIVINEVATNAAKHAFAQEETNRLSVHMEPSEDGKRIRLSISNSGPPMPVHVDVDNPASLGLELVRTLVRQLRGTIQILREPQTTFVMTMPTTQNG